MTSNKDEKTFKAIIFSALTVIVLSVAVCIFMLVKSENFKSAGSNQISQSPAMGEFVGYVTPSDDKIYSSEETVTLSATAKNGAQAYAMITGQKIPLTASSQSENGYTLLSGNVILPASQKIVQELGSVAFFVTYGGITQICYGGKITVAAYEAEEKASEPETYSSGGEATALVVTGMITEGKDVTKNELFYNPTYGNLVCGMTDYVVGRLIDFDDDGNEVEFYKLMSGRAVKADSNVRLVKADTVMNYNTVTLSASSASDGNKIIISEKMKVPYKLRYVGQNFTKGYEKLRYNAKPFTATAIDFVFEYTVSFSGNISSFSDEIVSGVDVSVNPSDKTLILHCRLRQPGKFYGYRMEYDENGNLCLSFRQPVRSISDLRVIIDPGHGGNPGALDYTGKYRESDQTLAISKHLAAYLSSAGASVYMTRTADNEVSLENRRLMNQQIKPDLFISIHLNGADNRSRSGTSTYYFTPFSQPLASCINNRLVEVYTESCYRDNPSMQKEANGGDRYYPFFVTRTDVCPSVLVETGFFTHQLESKYLIDKGYQQAFARAIYTAVEDFVNTQK